MEGLGANAVAWAQLLSYFPYYSSLSPLLFTLSFYYSQPSPRIAFFVTGSVGEEF